MNYTKENAADCVSFIERVSATAADVVEKIYATDTAILSVAEKLYKSKGAIKDLMVKLQHLSNQYDGLLGVEKEFDIDEEVATRLKIEEILEKA